MISLSTILGQLTPIGEIFDELGEKISHYVISSFEVLESFIKKLENLPEYFGKVMNYNIKDYSGKPRRS